MVFCFPLPYFPLSTSALFFASTLVLTLYIDVVLSLSLSDYVKSETWLIIHGSDARNG